MKSGVPWHVKGVRPQVRETAREAARRSGMSVGEWLDTVIIDSAIEEGVEPARRMQTEDDRYPAFDREGRYSDLDESPRPGRRRYSDPNDRYRRSPDEQLAEVTDRLHRLTQQLDRPRGRGPDENLAAVRARLDVLAQQLDQQHHHGPDASLDEIKARLDTLAQQFDQRDRNDSGEHLAAVKARLDVLAQQLDQQDRRGPDEGLDEIKARLDTLAQQFNQRGRSDPGEHLAAVNDRLDALARQLERLTAIQAANAQAVPAGERDDETPRLIADAISRLDGRLDQLIAEGRSATSEIERRMSAVDHAVAQLDRERPRASPADPATPLDQALLEIAERQRALDGETSPPRSDLPRAPTQDFGGLEQQLREITSRFETLRPCGIDGAVETLRDDLAEIGLMLKEAMPRHVVAALETEVRSLGERIDSQRHAGIDGAAVAGIERGLAEVRDVLHALTPAENLAGFDETVKALSHKVDRLASSHQDPAAFEQLESAIMGLRGIVSHVASNDALTTLSDEVRVLANKVEQTAGPDFLATLEQRIATIADALQSRHQPAQEARDVEAVVQGLSEKIERLHLSRADNPAVSHLEDRIVRLVEKLDASDARLGSLEAIERALTELLLHLEHQRIPQPAPAVAAELPQVDTLKREVRRTQDSLEAVHGTLGHVVDRLAMIETGIRSATAPNPPKAASIPIAPDLDPADEPAAASPPLGTAAPPALADVFAPPTAPAASSPMPAPPSARLAALDAAASTVRPDPVAEQAPVAPPTPPPSIPSALVANPAPKSAPQPERRPIDPSLPPDHPLEPGLAVRGRNGASPADRIAASEAALGPAKPPVIADPGSKSNFIAAARRAAQAAGSDAAMREKRTASTVEGGRPGGKPESQLGKRVRSILVAASIVMIVLGSLQLVLSLFGARQEGDESPPIETTQPAPDNDAPGPAAAPAPAPGGSNAIPSPPAAPAAPAPSPAAPGRQSVLLPAGVPYTAPSSGVMLPGEPARRAADATPKTPDSTPAEALVLGSVRAPALAAATSRPLDPPGPPLPSPAQPAGADKLPAAVGSAGLRAAAVKGDAAAEYEIAVRFAEGRGIPQDLTAAAEWFERSAKQGLVLAQFRLGALYEKGMGVKKDTDNARRLYAAAGQAGNAKAMHNLAVLYAEGIDGKPDYQTAAKWFRKAADYGVSDSQYNLGILYARGIGIEPNLAEAYKWFALAAREGDKEAAKKRDDVGARLDQSSLMAARVAAQVWSAEPQPEAATQVKVPAGGWDAAAVPPAAKRGTGPKADAAPQRTAQ